MKYKGIIFDFNGVLLFDSEWHTDAWQKVTTEIGKPLNVEQINNNHGRLGSEIFRELLGDKVSNSVIERWIERKEEIYREIALSKGKEFSLSPGAMELLDTLKSKNIPMTIATASEIGNLNFFIQHLNLSNWFNLNQIVFDNGNLPGKPSPVMYQKAAQNLNLNLSDCIIVEDSKMGLASAKNANAGKIIAIGPQEKIDILKNTPGVQKVITRLDEITLSDFE